MSGPNDHDSRPDPNRQDHGRPWNEDQAAYPVREIQLETPLHSPLIAFIVSANFLSSST
jgi:hypothetical protein